MHSKITLWAKGTAFPIKMRRNAFSANADITFPQLGNFEELLQQQDALCFIYQHVDCLYTLFKYQFSENIDVKSGKVLDFVQSAV